MTTPEPKIARTSAIDKFVGARLLELRKNMGLSQSDVAKIIGVTYQQVQKYEKGTSRLGTKGLQKLATQLNVPFAYFFQDYPQSAPILTSADVAGEEVTQFLSLFLKIKRPDLRQKILKQLRTYSESET